jgi:hypothetical protein
VPGTDRGGEFEERFMAASQDTAQALDRNARWGHTVAAVRSIADRLDSQRGEIRAQTEAIWRMIDRLDSDTEDP